MTRRRGHNEGSIRLRADGRWEARISLPTGKRKALYGRTRKEVQDKLRAAMRDLGAGLDIGRRPQTVSAFMAAWLADVVRSTRAPKTYASYAQITRLYIDPAIGTIPLDALAPRQVQKMMNDMSARGLSPRTVELTRAVLRAALGQAERESLVLRNVAALTTAPKKDGVRKMPLSATEARRFLEHVKANDARYWPLFVTEILTGLRLAELLGLRWDDVNVATRELRVRHTIQRFEGRWEFTEPKSPRSARTLSLPAAAAAALELQRDRQATEREAYDEAWAGRGLVFTSTRGTPIEPSNLNGRLHRLLHGAGLPRQGMHALRHCFASLLLAGKVDVRTLMEQLGHSQYSLTMDTYAHVMPAAMREAADVLDGMFGGAD